MTRSLPFGEWRAQAMRLGLVLGLPLLSVEVARVLVNGSVRQLSVVLVVLGAGLVAQLAPRGLLALCLALSPLPLYVQGLHASLLVPLVCGIWLSLLGAQSRDEVRLPSLGIRGYELPLLAVVATSLVALWRGASDRTGADLGALGTLAVGLALFCSCLVVIRSRDDLRLAFLALGLAGGIALAFTGLQLAAPSLQIPGLLTASRGTVQHDVYGISSNLRATGPLGDYELFAELLALVGTLGAYLGLRSHGRAAIAWLALVPAAIVGIALTSTRSGLVVLALGCALAVLGRRAAGRRLQLLPIGAGVWLVGLPLLHAIQSHAGTGYLFSRSFSVPSGGGLSSFLDRGQVWPFFLDRLPHGADLWLGHSLAFDYERYQTYPHSLPLTLVFTVGIAGAAAFALLLATIVWRCVAGMGSGAPYAGIGALLVVLFAVDELKIEYLRVFNYQWFVWGLLGVCAAAGRIREEPA